MNQGDIYMAVLDPVRGHEQAGMRPVLILQSSILNQKLSTLVIIPITSNLKFKGLTTTFFLPAKKAGLKEDSVALLHQIRTLDKNRLKEKVGHLDKDEILRLKEQLSHVIYTA